MDTNTLLAAIRREILTGKDCPATDLMTELDLRLARGDRLPDDWARADRRRGPDRRGRRAAAAAIVLDGHGPAAQDGQDGQDGQAARDGQDRRGAGSLGTRQPLAV